MGQCTDLFVYEVSNKAIPNWTIANYACDFSSVSKDKFNVPKKLLFCTNSRNSSVSTFLKYCRSKSPTEVDNRTKNKKNKNKK